MQGGYYSDAGIYLGDKVDWDEKLTANVMNANPAAIVQGKDPQMQGKLRLTESEEWKKLNRTINDNHYAAMCKNIYQKDKAKVTVKLEGRSFTQLKRSLRVTFSEKLGFIGGTLGLFSGFSLLAIMEMMHWMCTIVSSVISSKK